MLLQRAQALEAEQQKLSKLLRSNSRRLNDADTTAAVDKEKDRQLAIELELIKARI